MNLILKFIYFFYNIFLAWSNLFKISRLNHNEKKIIIYLESYSEWNFFSNIANAMSKNNLKYIIISSEKYKKNIPNINKNFFYIGYGSARTFLFRIIKTEIFFISLTNIDNLYLKKSINKINYIYIFHSIVSSHRIYEDIAFDNYDTIFCVGNHHYNEIRKREKIFKLKKKKLIKYGYPRLDNLIISSENFIQKQKKNLKVLIAPTWGESSLLNYDINNMISNLLESNINVVIRYHPMTLKNDQSKINQIYNKFINNNLFSIDVDLTKDFNIISSDILITEWSGIAMEFSFSTNRPVIFIDTPPKIKNIEWKKLDIECIEETLRSEIGIIVSTKTMNNINDLVYDLKNNINYWNNKILPIRNKYIYNLSKSSKIALNYIKSII